MLSSRGAIVASLRFSWSLGWLYLDELKGVLANCTEPLYHFGWRLLILHGKYPRLHVCFDKVNNDVIYKTMSK